MNKATLIIATLGGLITGWILGGLVPPRYGIIVVPSLAGALMIAAAWLAIRRR